MSETPTLTPKENRISIVQRRKLEANASFVIRSAPKISPRNSFQNGESPPLRIYIIRHGHSMSNQDPKVLQVLSDHTVPLSTKGKEQAEKCATFISKFFDGSTQNDLDELRKYSLWVSPYKRARETAKIIQDSGIGNRISKRTESIFLGEQQFGLFEGLSLAELSQKYPYEFSHFEKAIEYGGRFWARMPLGESRFDVAVRVQRFVYFF